MTTSFTPARSAFAPGGRGPGGLVRVFQARCHWVRLLHRWRPGRAEDGHETKGRIYRLPGDSRASA